MTTYYIDPEDIISDFLRTNLTDPRARAETSEAQTFSPTVGTSIITLAAPTAGSVSCITSVTIDGSSTNAEKWKNYYWDYQNTTLTFFNAFAGTETVVVTYKYGTTNWIYSDRPDEEISALNFPRISVFTISGSGRRLGQYNAPMESSPVLQIDVWSKDNQQFTINSRKYSNEYLARYLGNQVTKAFEDNESQLFPLLYNYTLLSPPRQADYAEEYQAFHTVIEVNLKALKLGRLEV